MRDNTSKSKTFTRRAIVLLLIKIIFFFVLAVRYFYLQIVYKSDFTLLSNKNRLRSILTAAERGLILDRNGSPLAININSYQLVFNSSNMNKLREYIEEISKLIKTEINFSSIKRLDNHDNTILSNLSWEDLSALQIHLYKFPLFEIKQIFGRQYVENAGHLIGYVGSYSQKEEQMMDERIPKSMKIGKNGVEFSQDSILRGKYGFKNFEVDSLGNIVRNLKDIEPTKGEDVVLSIDNKLQNHAYNLLKDKSGSLVVLNIKTGEVLSMYSTPKYNPNEFVNGISHSEWKSLLENPDKPLINKSISSAYPPGSTFKIVTAMAALRAGWDPNKKVFCDGKCQIGSRTFHCWNEHGHGYSDLKMAIARSCNIYFYEIAQAIGINKISETARLLGLGEKTDVELPFEVAGNIPQQQWKWLKMKSSWTLGDTINTSIGQGFTLVTPIQLTQLIASVASGSLIKPTIFKTSNQSFLNLNEEKHLEIIREGMYMAFYNQSGNSFSKRIDIPNFQMVGKTGTAQIVSKRKVKDKKLLEHGLFMGFAPFNDPTYAISAIIENGSWGSISALPVAKDMLLKVREEYGN